MAGTALGDSAHFAASSRLLISGAAAAALLPGPGAGASATPETSPKRSPILASIWGSFQYFMSACMPFFLRACSAALSCMAWETCTFCKDCRRHAQANEMQWAGD